MDYLAGLSLVVVIYLLYASRPSTYRSSTLSAMGSFPTRSKLLLE